MSLVIEVLLLGPVLQALINTIRKKDVILCILHNARHFLALENDPCDTLI